LDLARAALRVGAPGLGDFVTTALRWLLMVMLRVLWLFVVTFFQTVGRRRQRGGRPPRPTWTFSFEWIVRYLRVDWETTASWDFARLRADQNKRPFPQTMVKKLKETRDGDLGGVEARWFVPPASLSSSSKTILFFHGGSYIYGSTKTTHADLAARLALLTGATVIGVDYRLAPEHPYPAQIEDAKKAFDALVKSGVNPSDILLAGDSAGGNLAIELQLLLRDEEETQAAAAILISPWSDLEMPGASFENNDAFDFGTRADLVRHAEAYRGGGKAALSDPKLSPVNANLEGLNPCFVLVSECEIPRDDILRLTKKLEAAGVDVTLHEAKDMPHNAPMFAAYHPTAERALAAIATFVKKRSSVGAEARADVVEG